MNTVETVTMYYCMTLNISASNPIISTKTILKDAINTIDSLNVLKEKSGLPFYAFIHYLKGYFLMHCFRYE
jgi:hypothetical protein